MTKKNSIKILVTGGTIDKTYNQLTGELTFSSTHIQEIFLQAKVNCDLHIEPLMLKDSLYFSEHDRQLILKKCQLDPATRILITHGTDTMVETGRVLGLAKLEKTIVLTGAMVPVTMAKSDAHFNLGFALGAVQALPKGVYLAMNGQIFPWNNVLKNKKMGRFEKIK